MKQLTCEMCGGTDLLKQDGVFVCQNCGMKYSVEDAKKMMIEGTVDIQGTVKVDNSAIVEKHLMNAHRALMKEDWEEVEKYYNLVEQNSPDNMEAVFFSSYGKAMLAMTDSDYFKRQQKFEVLNRSLSVISEYYDTTSENKEEALKKISTYIKKMYNVTFVYQKQGLDLAGAINSLSGAIGTKQWCINLIDSTKNAFLKELREISQKHNDKFVMDIINEFDPSSPSSNKPQYNSPVASSQNTKLKTQRSVSLGMVGIITSFCIVFVLRIMYFGNDYFLFMAILSHVSSIMGIIFGVKEKADGRKTGFILSIIGEACAIASTIYGMCLYNIRIF